MCSRPDKLRFFTNQPAIPTGLFNGVVPVALSWSNQSSILIVTFTLQTLLVNNSIFLQMEEQREQLMETARKNTELVKALQEKEYELARQLEASEKQELILEQNEETIARLTAKEQEHYNKINNLVHALEEKATTDTEVSEAIILIIAIFINIFRNLFV